MDGANIEILGDEQLVCIDNVTPKYFFYFVTGKESHIDRYTGKYAQYIEFLVKWETIQYWIDC